MAATKPTEEATNPGCCAGGVRGAWRRFGACLHETFCVSEEDSPYTRLEKMHEERQKQLAAARKKAAELAEAEEQRAKEWQEELQQLQQRREGMTQEELEHDCQSYFATFELMHESAPPSRQGTPLVKEIMPPELDPSPGRAPDDLLAGAVEQENQECAEAAVFTGPFEDWLQQFFGASPVVEDGRPIVQEQPRSVGELPASACEGLAKSLRDALNSSADKADSDLQEERQSSSDASDELKVLIAKFANFSSRSIEETAEDSSSEKQAQLLEKLRARAGRHRAVSKRLTALLPLLEEDTVSARLVAALAVMDVAADEEMRADANLKDFCSPMRALSTADVCWALCSEKRHLVVDCLLPSTAAHGQWSWPELRRTGLGWWLRGPGTEEALTTVVTKLAQSAVMQLKRRTDAQKLDIGSPDKEARRLVDEAVFWYVLLGAKIQKLQALLKTGVLRGDPALKALLEHQRCGQETFMRKNAFCLLQKHRYNLAAALFILCDHCEDAAKVIAGHMRDLQLTVLVSRLKPEVAVPLLRDRLQESALVRRDRWLRFLLAWHANDFEAAQRAATGEFTNSEAAVEDGAVPPLFDGVLRLSEFSDGLAEVAQRLLTESTM